MMMRGWKLNGKVDKMWLEKDGCSIVFDIVISAPKGRVYCMYFKRSANELANSNADMKVSLKAKLQKWIIEQVHSQLAHCNKDEARRIAASLGIEILRGKLKPCKACLLGKARQNNVVKFSKHIKADKEDERRVFLDITTLRWKDKKGSSAALKHWRIIVDKQSTLKFSDFYDTKNGMVEATCMKFNRWKQTGKAVKYLRMDNAGENKVLE